MNTVEKLKKGITMNHTGRVAHHQSDDISIDHLTSCGIVEQTEKVGMNPSESGLHAILQDPSTGQVHSVFAKTKANLAKEIATMYPPEIKLLGVFRGKKLNIQAKTQYSFT